MNSVFAKWKSARTELEGPKEEEEEPSEDIEERRKLEIEQWKSEQLATGESENNANFVPVTDWRERVERARRIQQKALKEKNNSSTSETT